MHQPQLDYAKLIQTEEPLHPDLQLCLREHDYGDGAMRVLHHPLIIHVMYDEKFNALLNAQYIARLAALQAYIKDNAYYSIISIHERPYRMWAFRNYVENQCKKMKDYWSILRQIWVDTENMWEHLDDWVDLLHHVSRTRFMTRGEYNKYLELPDNVIVFRGCHNFNENGLSWTTDIRVAEFFANRWPDKGHIIQGVVNKSDIIAYFTGRSEYEIVCLPDTVQQINRRGYGR